jgi:nucleoside-diphosphate-sugar epimerase
MPKLIFGCGYLGSRVARRWLDAGEEVAIVTRSRERAAELSAAGYQAIVADVLRPATLADLPSADTVLFAVGYDRASGAAIHDVYVGGLHAVLGALPTSTGKFLYISSTGVYGSAGGHWVDEETPCDPQRPGGRACLEAEQLLAAHALGKRAIVLRMAGIYGPGRLPNAADIRAERPIAAPEHGALNLIHVDDAAAVVVAAGLRGAPPRCYTVSDGHPAERRAYYEELARLLHAPPPTFAVPSADSPAAARAAADKRVKNTRLLAELQVTLAYPSYREGLAAIVAAEASESGGY